MTPERLQEIERLASRGPGPCDGCAGDGCTECRGTGNGQARFDGAIPDLLAEVRRLQGEIRARDEEIDAARKRIAAYDEQLLASGPRIAALESENSSLRTAVGLAETMTRHRGDAKREIAAALGLASNATIGEIVAAAHGMAGRVVALEAEVHAADRRLDDQHDSTIVALSAELDQAHRAGAVLLADRAALAGRCVDLVHRATSIEMERNDLSARVRRHEAGRLPQGEDLIANLRRKHAEQIERRDRAIDALARRVAEVIADCDRMQDAAVDVITRLLDENWRRGEAARRVAAYARKLRIAERVL